MRYTQTHYVSIALAAGLGAGAIAVAAVLFKPLLAPEHAPSRTSLEGLRAGALRDLASSPVDGQAWLQLSYVAFKREGRLEGQAVDALAQSFRHAPLDPDLFVWRTRYCLENWPSVPPPLRKATLAHIRARLGSPEGRKEVLALRIAEPSGALALGLAVNGAKAGARPVKTP